LDDTQATSKGAYLIIVHFLLPSGRLDVQFSDGRLDRTSLRFHSPAEHGVTFHRHRPHEQLGFDDQSQRATLLRYDEQQLGFDDQRQYALFRHDQQPRFDDQRALLLRLVAQQPEPFISIVLVRRQRPHHQRHILQFDNVHVRQQQGE
jgi:hypothetical protein